VLELSVQDVIDIALIIAGIVARIKSDKKIPLNIHYSVECFTVLNTSLLIVFISMSKLYPYISELTIQFAWSKLVYL